MLWGTPSSSSEHEWPSEDEDADWGDEQRRPLRPWQAPRSCSPPAALRPSEEPMYPPDRLLAYTIQAQQPMNGGRLIWSPTLEDERPAVDRELYDWGEVHHSSSSEPLGDVRRRGQGDQGAVLHDQGEDADSPPPQPPLPAALHVQGEVHDLVLPAPPPVVPLLPDSAQDGHLVDALAAFGVPQHDLQRLLADGRQLRRGAKSEKAATPVSYYASKTIRVGEKMDVMGDSDLRGPDHDGPPPVQGHPGEPAHGGPPPVQDRSDEPAPELEPPRDDPVPDRDDPAGASASDLDDSLHEVDTGILGDLVGAHVDGEWVSANYPLEWYAEGGELP